jgi:hypothetical protein
MQVPLLLLPHPARAWQYQQTQPPGVRVLAHMSLLHLQGLA